MCFRTFTPKRQFKVNFLHKYLVQTVNIHSDKRQNVKRKTFLIQQGGQWNIPDVMRYSRRCEIFQMMCNIADGTLYFKCCEIFKMAWNNADIVKYFKWIMWNNQASNITMKSFVENSSSSQKSVQPVAMPKHSCLYKWAKSESSFGMSGGDAVDASLYSGWFTSSGC